MARGGLALRKVRAKWADRPTGFVWVEKGKIAASGYPASRRQLAWLSSQGIRSVLTLTESPLPGAWLEGLGLESKHIPMVDHDPPKVASLDEAAAYIAKNVRAGKPIAVHCLAGKGRTMCAIGAFLMKESGEKPDSVIRRLRNLQSGAVEQGQEKALEDYSFMLRSGSGQSGSTAKQSPL